MPIPGSSGRLLALIETVCAVNTLSVGNWNDRASWIINFKDDTTQQQKDQIQNIINNFDQYDQVAEDNYRKDLEINNIDLVLLKISFNHENRIRILENRPAITLDQFKIAIRLLLN